MTSFLFYGLATRPEILDTLNMLLGDDVMLWGASIVSRRPGQVHPWHTDIETAASAGNAVSVWIGLANTNERSSLQVVSGSHRLETTIQQLALTRGKTRGEADRQQVVRWASEIHPDCEFVNVAMSNGEAVFFDGRLWHGSDNTNPRGTRVALLLQYATPDVPIRVPDHSVLEWPFRFLPAPRPPCIMVRGSNRYHANEFVPAPQQNHSPKTLVTKWISSLELQPEQRPAKAWAPRPIFRGRTRVLEDLSCHMSVLQPGHTPHAPHRHEEEELLIMLSGEARLVAVDSSTGQRRERVVDRGAVAYYPAGHVHTITSVGQDPAIYVMFKWHDRDSDRSQTLGESIHEVGGAPKGETPFATTKVFQGPTRYLRKLHCHRTSLAPGAGYPAHMDAYDVALILLQGEVETLGQRVTPDSVVFYGAGEPHGITNVGSETAEYLVFEFHGNEKPLSPGWNALRRWSIRAAKRIGRKAGLGRLLRRFRARPR